MVENFDGMEETSIFAGLDPALKRREKRLHTHSGGDFSLMFPLKSPIS